MYIRLTHKNVLTTPSNNMFYSSAISEDGIRIIHWQENLPFHEYSVLLVACSLNMLVQAERKAFAQEATLFKGCSPGI